MRFWERASAMTQPAFHTDYERAVNLIPAYLKNSLSADDSAWMKGFLDQLQSDTAQAAAFAEEMKWVEKTQTQMNQALPHIDVEAGWAHLAGQLRSAAAPQAAQPLAAASADQPSLISKAMQWASDMIKQRMNGLLDLWRKPAVVVLGSAMIVGQMGLRAAVVKKLYSAETTSVAIPASGSKGAASDQVITVQVIFKDKTSVADIRKLLDASGAQIVGGPSAIGVWEVQIDKSKQTAAIDQISKSKTVESISLP
jgi:hypothetical protein